MRQKAEICHVCISKKLIFNIFTNCVQVLVGKLSVFVMCEELETNHVRIHERAGKEEHIGTETKPGKLRLQS